jgi:hypothetical protein
MPSLFTNEIYLGNNLLKTLTAFPPLYSYLFLLLLKKALIGLDGFYLTNKGRRTKRNKSLRALTISLSSPRL